MDMVPTLLGAVAGTITRDAEVLTRSTSGCDFCDFTTDYAKANEMVEDSPLPEQSDA